MRKRPLDAGKDPSLPCPCGGNTSYRTCCATWHRGAAAPDAEKLMRSRYCAYVLRLDDYLLETWHPTTRPPMLDSAVAPAPTFLGLDVKQHVVTGAAAATVEFIARYRVGGRARRMHEVSHFVLEQGKWFYLDGNVIES